MALVKFTLNGKAQTVDAAPAMPLLWGPTGSARSDWDEVRLWDVAMRGLHGAHQWAGRPFLRHSGFNGGRKDRSYHRGAFGQFEPSHPAGLG